MVKYSHIAFANAIADRADVGRPSPDLTPTTTETAQAQSPEGDATETRQVSTWFRCESSLADHPKTEQLAQYLGIHTILALGHISALFGQVALMKPDGVLDRCTAKTIAKMARWEGDPDPFLRALLSSGFVDRRPDSELEIHGWLERHSQRSQAAERYSQHAETASPQKDFFASGPNRASTPVSNTRALALSDKQTNKQTNKEECSEMARAPSSEPALLTFPAVGPVRQWHLSSRVLEDLQEAFPDIDVLSEARKALEWIRALPKRRKTVNGYRRFLFNWLSRVQDRGAATGPGSVRLTPGERMIEDAKRKYREACEEEEADAK